MALSQSTLNNTIVLLICYRREEYSFQEPLFFTALYNIVQRNEVHAFFHFLVMYGQGRN